MNCEESIFPDVWFSCAMVVSTGKIVKNKKARRLLEITFSRYWSCRNFSHFFKCSFCFGHWARATHCPGSHYSTNETFSSRRVIINHTHIFSSALTSIYISLPLTTLMHFAYFNMMSSTVAFKSIMG